MARTLQAVGVGSISDWGTRSHMLQQKIKHAATKTQCSQINIKKKKRKKERNKNMDGELGLAEEDISGTLRLRASEHLDTL